MNKVTENHSGWSSVCFFSRQHTLLIGLALLTVACKKDDPEEPETEEPPVSSTTVDMAATPGSWWRYEWYDIEGSGLESPKGISDSIYVAGDTIINGNTFVHFSGTFLGSMDFSRNMRDSLGYILSGPDRILFSAFNQTDTISVTTENDLTAYTIINIITGPVTVPAGTFSHILQRQIHYYKTDGSSWACSPYWVKREYFVEGVGVILSQEAFYSQLMNDCSYMEKRLVNYHIAP